MRPLSNKHRLLYGGTLGVLLTILLLAGYANLSRIIEAGLRRHFGSQLAIGSVELHWDSISLHRVSLSNNPDNPQPGLLIRKITINPSFGTFFSRHFKIDSVLVENPWALVEIAPDGRIVNPLPPLSPKGDSKKGGNSGSYAVTIDSLDIRHGEVTILDRHVARLGRMGLSNPREKYHTSIFTDVSLHTGRIELQDPVRAIPFRLDCKAPVNGTFKLEGAVSPATMNGSARLELRQWDITRFHPYYQEPGDMTTTRGSLSADCSITVKDRLLHAPGVIRLKEMTVDAAGSRSIFFGMPSKAVIWFLENNKEELVINFTVSGSLDNPRFKVRQALMDQLGSSLAQKMGIPLLSEMGKGLVELGSKGVRGVKNVLGGHGR